MEKRSQLSKRYFDLVERVNRLKFIEQTTYYNETLKRGRIRKLLRITNRKVSILEKILSDK